ncbi:MULTISPECIES: NAD(P)H-dependent oxidoreductase [Aerococcus]|uniref:NAD(P)H-dependent oxidoreductase n=1 Tax=Aerococcus loyolae TaxID=2976809 RepID=A0ABT4C0X9_9LACT|nr:MULTISPECIES: NAD(P)H-dependent oxidoreductase [Aerococcus]MCY3026156.1 NAD(P)H-dependent oxidoreductase [Aerococcus loyolae]MCY3027971.1 NAD(P)H-dependent oxidoreductase [Aerococcus loyolae]MCY3029787.1 NAD(P)H-dependent oxidoreductase [Aerococcus loyolae]MDK6258634.1 NAD(P)H-dependent oxidoreductase [Aerococcus urinae]MDK6294440.1 NAD(P)H-dependent oxidoreductase [Aerococcus urinae]
MTVSIFCGHPDLENSSSHQFLRAACPEEIHFIPIPTDYDEHFIQESQEILLKSERIYLQFPLYWYQAPGHLVQWLQDLLSDDFLDQNGKRLVGKSLGLIVTVGSPLSYYQAGGKNNVSLSTLFSPYQTLCQTLKWEFLPAFILSQYHYLSEADQFKHYVAFQYYLLNPKRGGFSQRSRWLIDRLRSRQEDFSPELSSKVDLLIDAWEGRLDELEMLDAELPKTTRH